MKHYQTCCILVTTIITSFEPNFNFNISYNNKELFEEVHYFIKFPRSGFFVCPSCFSYLWWCFPFFMENVVVTCRASLSAWNNIPFFRVILLNTNYTTINCIHCIDMYNCKYTYRCSPECQLKTLIQNKTSMTFKIKPFQPYFKVG